MRDRIIVLISLFLLSTLTWSQQQPAGNSAPAGTQQSMPGMDMPAHDMSNMNMKDMPMGDNSDASAHAMHSMEGHMDMGPHMKMTALRPAKPGDAERAKEVVEEARKASEHYTDYHVALAEGFKIFHPEFPQKMYHFTNYRYAMEAAFHFDPKRLTEDELDQRIPLSVAQWHEHVNFCAAPPDRRGEGLLPHPQFGLRGSIVTQEACDAAGGTFHPVVFNWMVHVYPFEKDPASIWSVNRQHGDAD